MPVSRLFSEELRIVDRSKSFQLRLAEEFGVNEWSVDGYTITAGSEAALEHGASEALYQMGYRFFDPMTTVRPEALPENGVALERRQNVFPYVRVFENYGRGKLAVNEHKRWLVLNCIDDRRRPVGHSWGRIIRKIEEEDSFFSRNPTFLIRHNGKGPIAFNLSLRGDERAALIERVVYYLAANLNEEHRHIFDPEDGDIYPTDDVIDFSNEVVAKLRETVPDAKLGVYAYANHREPPSNPCPHLYIQVALGFNDLGIGYQAMVQKWGAKAGEIALRGYGDIAAWQGFLPCNSAIARSDYFVNEYPGYIASGADSLNMETSGNWVRNIVSHYHMIRFCRDGKSTYADVLEDITQKAFSGDSKVTELFELWGSLDNNFNTFTLHRSMQIVQSMPDEPYKERFQIYLTICYHHWDLTPDHKTKGAFDNRWSDAQKAVYFRKLEQNLNRANAFGMTGHFHSYGYVRRLGNVNVSKNGRPDLAFNAQPYWQRFPEMPTQKNFETALSALADVTRRPAQLEYKNIDDLVIVEVAPKGAAALPDGDAVDFTTRGSANFVFSGPGVVSTRYVNEWRPIDVREFGPGLHRFTVSSKATTTWSGGLLFLSGFPQVWLNPPQTSAPAGGGNRWMYIPRLVIGDLRLAGSGRLTIHDENGRFDIVNETPQNITAGVARVDKVNTTGTHMIINANPFFSSSAYKMLMPRSLAHAEFRAGLVVRVIED